MLKHDWLYFDRGYAAECQRCKMVAWSINLPQGPCRPKSPVEVHHPYLAEQLEVLRRIAERGKKLAEMRRFADDRDATFVDIFVHLLDEIERTRTNA